MPCTLVSLGRSLRGAGFCTFLSLSIHNQLLFFVTGPVWLDSGIPALGDPVVASLGLMESEQLELHLVCRWRACASSSSVSIRQDITLPVCAGDDWSDLGTQSPEESLSSFLVTFASWEMSFGLPSQDGSGPL